jgi:hypothetical protein
MARVHGGRIEHKRDQPAVATGDNLLEHEGKPAER